MPDAIDTINTPVATHARGEIVKLLLLLSVLAIVRKSLFNQRVVG